MKKASNLYPKNLKRNMELMTYTKAQIHNNISKLLEEGKSNDDALHFFLKMKMVNDLGPERPFITKAPSPAEVKIHLLGYDDIPQDDVILELPNQAKNNTQRLVFKLSPAYALYVEKAHDSLQVTVNGKNLTAMYLKTFRAADIALWMIRQRHKLDKYIEEWDTVLDLACKKSKLDRMAFLKIRAIFTEAMKDYPRLKYVIVDPNTDVGVYIDAWWGSYEEKLPPQIESLKLLLDAHRKSCLKNFFVHH